MAPTTPFSFWKKQRYFPLSLQVRRGYGSKLNQGTAGCPFSIRQGAIWVTCFLPAGEKCCSERPSQRCLQWSTEAMHQTSKTSVWASQQIRGVPRQGKILSSLTPLGYASPPFVLFSRVSIRSLRSNLFPRGAPRAPIRRYRPRSDLNPGEAKASRRCRSSSRASTAPRSASCATGSS